MYSYSQRLSWSFSSNPLTQLLIQKRTAGVPFLDLTASNPTQCLPGYPHEEIRNAFGQVRDFTYCPDPLGSHTARSAVAKYYRDRGVFISLDQLALTASTSEAYSYLFKLLCDAGDELLTPLPSYPLFEYLAAFESVRTIPYRLRYDGTWYLDMASLRARMNRRTKAIIIVNPNNPTGTFLSQEERSELLNLARQFSLPIISDEVFGDYIITPGAPISTTLAENDSVLTFSLNGLSKTAGMPQMKLGWIAIGGPAQARQEARQRLEITADTYLSVGTPVQHALSDLLQIGAVLQQQLLQRIKQNIAIMDNLTKGTAIQRLYLHGGWSSILQLPRTLTEEDWVRGLLQEENVLVQPGYFFDMESEAYIVLSLITSPDEFREGVGRICSYVSRHS